MTTLPKDVVVKTVSLLRALTREYGAEKSMEVWENLSDLIDDSDLKMDVFKVMLTGGNIGRSLEVISWDGAQKVTAIKALRAATGAGLKESKDAVEAAINGTKTEMLISGNYHEQTNDGPSINYGRIESDLRAAGLTIEFV
jgi:ribosomal protein L7/L12